jgi:carbamate kinase
VIALGGNAISPAGTAGTAAEQTDQHPRTMAQVAELVAEGSTELVLTHGNGPQVGNVLIKNELARDVVPPVPLDWCVAQTQATIGFTIASTLTYELAQRGLDQPVVPVVSRVLVAGRPRLRGSRPSRSAPTSPTTPRWHVAAEGTRFVRQATAGWRRVVPRRTRSRCVDRPAVELLLDDGAIVVANGGGGIPVVDDGDGPLRGVEAVIDKDLAGALLAEELGAGLRRPDRRPRRRRRVRHARRALARRGHRRRAPRPAGQHGQFTPARWARRSRRCAGSSSAPAAAP